MKLKFSIIALIVAAAGLALFATRRPSRPEITPLADHVPATAVIYIGIADVNGPRTALVERLLGPDRISEIEKGLPAGIEGAAIYATHEEGALHWRAVARVKGVLVHKSWTSRPVPDGPSLASRPEFGAAWTGTPSNVRVWIDLEGLGIKAPTEDFRALALDAGPDTATGMALYSPKAAACYREKSQSRGRTGRLPDAAFAAAGSDRFEHIAARLGLDDRFPYDAVGPAWGCVLRGKDLVVFVEAADPDRAERAVERIGKPNYRFEGGWCLWASDARAIDGFVPTMGGAEQGAIHFTPEAAAALEDLLVRYGRPLPFRLERLGALDAVITYRLGGADIRVVFR